MGPPDSYLPQTFEIGKERRVQRRGGVVDFDGRPDYRGGIITSARYLNKGVKDQAKEGPASSSEEAGKRSLSLSRHSRYFTPLSYTPIHTHLAHRPCQFSALPEAVRAEVIGGNRRARPDRRQQDQKYHYDHQQEVARISRLGHISSIGLKGKILGRPATPVS